MHLQLRLVVTWLVPCETAAILAHVMCTWYLKPCTSLQCHFMQSQIHRVHMCLAVTGHLHFWQNDWDLLCATAVMQGWDGYQNKIQHRKLTLGKRILLPLLLGLEPETFWSWVHRSTTELSLLPKIKTRAAQRCLDSASQLMWQQKLNPSEEPTD